MKKLFAFICATVLVTSTYAYRAEVNEKVLKSFRETFNLAEEVKWEEYNTYYTVSFVHGGIQSKVNYDKEGSMLSSISYYAPTMLPLNIFNRLKKDYQDKSLYGVTEVTSGTDVTYFIKMQDAKNWITIRVDANGNAQVYEKYKRV